MKGLEMVKCESLRMNMYRITHTGKSMNFPVTLFRSMSEPDKKIQKEMTNAAGRIKLSIYKEKVPIYCVFVTEISRNTYSLLTT